MDIFSPVLYGLAQIIDIALSIYMWIVIGSAILSWVSPDPYNPIVRTLRNLTEPVFWRVRRWLPFLNIGGLDLSPMVVILAVIFLKTALVGVIANIARAIG